MTADTAHFPDDGTWFAVLPDTDAGGAAARLLRDSGALEEIPHASGRPWLLGRWAPGGMTVVHAGAVRVAAAGPGAAALRAARVAPHRDTGTIWPLDPTLAAERWLRTTIAGGSR
ncbi:hypothetical protein [Streptomyces olivoreticuli]|uniref:hypothetical protein n=1 Tax=Streptomyces olivoreticuli TaxID=68246 RepID=UPI000E2622CB|nr:hypothetical protein [Streptomyces olivoreticuli]